MKTIKVLINIDRGLVWEAYTDANEAEVQLLIYDQNIDYQTIRKLKVKYEQEEEIRDIEDIAEDVEAYKIIMLKDREKRKE